MSPNRKNVVRFDLPQNPAFDQRLAHESDIDLTVCARAGPQAAGWAALERSHVYHVSATKDELPWQHIVGALKGGRPPRLINPEVWPAYAARFEAVLGARVQVLDSE